ncbi:MAG: hypothetical protein ACOCPZ_02920 [Natrialbaceae archaeon]
MSRSIPAGGWRRRRLCGALGLLAVGALAGCSGASTTGDGGSDGESSDESDGSDGEDLDLQEANVVGVEIGESGEAYEFDVTLHHDNEGEDGYADWWQVERPDGTRLGRRDLAHPHTEQPFTRSGAVEIPDEVDCVVVRGHDQTHGYGGRAMVVTVNSGATRTVDQGREPDSFEDIGCP